MTMTILGTLGALVTILGPAVAAWLITWIDNKREERTHATTDQVDAFIKQHMAGNSAGLVSLSHELERLQREARRKGRHTRLS